MKRINDKKRIKISFGTLFNKEDNRIERLRFILYLFEFNKDYLKKKIKDFIFEDILFSSKELCNRIYLQYIKLYYEYRTLENYLYSINSNYKLNDDLIHKYKKVSYILLNNKYKNFILFLKYIIDRYNKCFTKHQKKNTNLIDIILRRDLELNQQLFLKAHIFFTKYRGDYYHFENDMLKLYKILLQNNENYNINQLKRVSKFFFNDIIIINIIKFLKNKTDKDYIDYNVIRFKKYYLDINKNIFEEAENLYRKNHFNINEYHKYYDKNVLCFKDINILFDKNLVIYCMLIDNLINQKINLNGK